MSAESAATFKNETNGTTLPSEQSLTEIQNGLNQTPRMEVNVCDLESRNSRSLSSPSSASSSALSLSTLTVTDKSAYDRNPCLSIVVLINPHLMEPGFKLVGELMFQAEKLQCVEVVSYIENGWHTNEARRHAVLDLCSGNYVTFVSPNDWIASDYVAQLVASIQYNSDMDMYVVDVLMTGFEKLGMPPTFIGRVDTATLSMAHVAHASSSSSSVGFTTAALPGAIQDNFCLQLLALETKNARKREICSNQQSIDEAESCRGPCVDSLGVEMQSGQGHADSYLKADDVNPELQKEKGDALLSVRGTSVDRLPVVTIPAYYGVVCSQKYARVVFRNILHAPSSTPSTSSSSSSFLKQTTSSILSTMKQKWSSKVNHPLKIYFIPHVLYQHRYSSFRFV